MAIVPEFAAYRSGFDALDTPSFHLRRLKGEDAPALLACYSDPDAVRLMNDDNCRSGFLMTDEEQVRESIRFWEACEDFVRQCVVDKASGEPVGTLEVCAHHDGVVILRIDLRTDYEREALLRELIAVSTGDVLAACPSAKCVMVKAIPEAAERRRALEACGFTGGHQIMQYPHYYRLDRP